MDVAGALRVLGLPDSPAWGDVRAAHRAAIVRTHPDAGGSAVDAARVNQAFDLLRKVTSDGANSVPQPTAPRQPPPPATRAAPTPPDRLVPDDDPVDLLMRMADAAHDIGEVVFVDSHDGLLEVVVGEPPGVGQLTASVEEATEAGVPVSFTLEPLGVAEAPPIHEVVDELMTLVRRRPRRAGGRPPGST
ncbi:MAG: hypothetical protein AAF081_18760 [Actinomycetota bacterium]